MAATTGRADGARRAARGAAAALLVLAAAAAQAAELSPRDRADVARVERYLDSLRSLRSAFVQASSDGGRAEGTILLRRPDRLRLDYRSPPGVEIHVDGDWLVHVDANLEAVTHVPVSRTPARFLVGRRIRLSGDVTARAVTREAGSVSVELVSSGEPEAGSFTLTLSDAPLTLRRWTVVDVQGVTTTVTLSEPRFNVEIPAEAFDFDPLRFEPETP